MFAVLTRAALLALLAASLSGCVTFNDAVIHEPGMQESDPGPGAPIRPGFENRNGCQQGFHGVPFPNGNSFRCVANGW